MGDKRQLGTLAEALQALIDSMDEKSCTLGYVESANGEQMMLIARGDAKRTLIECIQWGVEEEVFERRMPETPSLSTIGKVH